MSRSPVDLCMAAVQLTRKKPRTRCELAGLLGIEPHHASRYLKAMESEGLVKRERPDWKGRRGGSPDRWTWVEEAI